MKPDSIVFYKSFYEAIKVIPDATARLEAYEAVLGYAFKDVTEDVVIANPFANIVLEMAKPQIDANNKRRLNGSKGGAPAGNQNARKNNLKQAPVELENNQKQPNVNVNVNENVNVNVKEIKAKAKRFTPPTLENVSEYCQEKGLNVDAQRFINYYESNGWKVGRNPMKDWKATVKNWDRNDINSNVQGVSGRRQDKKTKFSNFDEREYDFAELERTINQ